MHLLPLIQAPSPLSEVKSRRFKRLAPSPTLLIFLFSYFGRQTLGLRYLKETTYTGERRVTTSAHRNMQAQKRPENNLSLALKLILGTRLSTTIIKTIQ